MGKKPARPAPANTPSASARSSPLWLLLPAAVAVAIITGVVLNERERTPTPADTTRPADFDPLSDADESPPAMVAVPGGTLWMGSNDGAKDEQPVHEVKVSAFQMDATEITVGQFAAFVKATGYVTISERFPDPAKYPNADPEFQKPGSAVFTPIDAPLRGPWGNSLHPPWWSYVGGASWRCPEGPPNSVKDKKNHPAVQIAWDDAAAYAKWAGKRLPTEAEWEWAARGGLDRKPYCWGDAKPGEGGKWHANAYQGKFPAKDTGADGFAGLAPVKNFPPNGYGLYDMSGNAWEWCSDWYDPDYYAVSPKDNPQGPTRGALVEGNPQPQKVRRGGSFLCDDSYCRRYVPSARDKNPADSSANHTGFRCVK